ncbi:MAG TPA: DUF1885 family protein [Bacillus sp. (in: firmicutes)]|uniref:DUF1885 family protein n=1 Tax=Bacillus litorisediminis TaxID=2922713 RepID=UPI001FAC7C47|nr:DUF1885 family protein [Bacillus litorisediminis]HWO74855.1 DUF1885 family protein [Bacillus sp. (in: firmicutes)]
MNEAALIKVTPHSQKESISYEDVKEILEYYQEITHKTGEQLSWDYDQMAFPYTVIETKTSEGTYLLLKSKEDPHYHSILIDIPNTSDDSPSTLLRITLPPSSTLADKGKANELCRFIAKKWEAELKLFNNRVMYFDKRK